MDLCYCFTSSTRRFRAQLNFNSVFAAFNTLSLDTKQQGNIFNKMARVTEDWMEFIDISFLSTGFKESMKKVITDRFNRLDDWCFIYTVLLIGNCQFWLGHNHPSSRATPSEADMKITKKLKDSGALLEISVLDHIIVAHDVYYSFADEGTM